MDYTSKTFSPLFQPNETKQNSWVLFDKNNPSTPPQIPSRKTTGMVLNMPLTSTNHSTNSSNYNSSNTFHQNLFDYKNKLVDDNLEKSLLSPIISSIPSSSISKSNVSFSTNSTQQNINDSSSNMDSYVPPIPPRKEHHLPTEYSEDLLNFDQKSFTKSEDDEKTEFLDIFPKLNIFDKVETVSSVNDEIFSGEILLRPAPTSTIPDPPRSTKKKKGGYEHLHQSDSDEENSLAIDVIITDASPSKPLSRWVRMQNESEETRQAGSNDVLLFDDVSINGEDFENSDRLSADSCALKGFNRVDRGSQNNLVDFSETEDHISSFHHDDVISSPVMTSQTTNPFHNTSTAISETSSTELNPFDKIHFLPQRLTSSASSTPIPMIPPPPGSLGRYRRKRITSQSSVNNSLPIVTSQTRSLAVLDDLPMTDQIKEPPLLDNLYQKDLEESFNHHSSLKSLEDPKDTKEDLCSLNPMDLIPTATSWNMEMRFPQQKRVMTSRRWVPIYVTISVESITRPSLNLYHNSQSPKPFCVVHLGKNDWQMTQPKLQHATRYMKDINQVTNDQLAPFSTTCEPPVVTKKLHSIKFLHVRFKEKYSFLAKRDQLLLKSPVGFRHSVQSRQIVKLGSEKYSDLLSLISTVEDVAFNANKLVSKVDVEEVEDDVTLPEIFPNNKFYSREEIVIDVRDEFRGIISADGKIERSSINVRIFVTSFISRDCKVTVGFNDVKVLGNEQVRRCDVIPSSNDDWISVNDVKLHRCCSLLGYDKGLVTFKPIDACRFELMRYTADSKDPRLPLNIKPSISVSGTHITLRCILLSNSKHASNKDTLTQVPCEKLSIRFPIPKQLVGLFQRKTPTRGSHSFRSKKCLRQPYKESKGATLQTSVGVAKYEHAHGSLVWYMERFPEKNAALNTPHVLTCNLELQGHSNETDLMEAVRCEVEYTMPSVTASRTCIRSVALEGCNQQVEKFTCYSAHYFYNLEVSITTSQHNVCSMQ